MSKIEGEPNITVYLGANEGNNPSAISLLL